MIKLAIKDQYSKTWLLNSNQIESVEDVREIFNSDDNKTISYTFNLTYIDADDNKHRLYLGASKCVNDIESFIQTTELRTKLMNVLNDERLNVEVSSNNDTIGLNDRYGSTLNIGIDDIDYYED
ncbi:MAG: hypothetical protein KAG14_02865, partial [Mycoplasmataceae bacterium]|nr:hypothetical protein [Mycoplasmataceae bacterium]